MCIVGVMGDRINIYLPSGLHEKAKAAGLNVSRICREALEGALVRRLHLPAGQAPGDKGYLPLPEVNCTNLGRTVGAYKVRHVGERKQLGYQTICSVCEKSWR